MIIVQAKFSPQGQIKSMDNQLLILKKMAKFFVTMIKLVVRKLNKEFKPLLIDKTEVVFAPVNLLDPLKVKTIQMNQ